MGAAPACRAQPRSAARPSRRPAPLEVEFRRPPAAGSGAGRPAKLYCRASRELEVSLPERRYELAGRVMAQAIVDAAHDGVPIAAALRGTARALAALGEEARRRAGWCAGQAALLAAARGVLAEHSHEPRTNPGEPIPAA